MNLMGEPAMPVWIPSGSGVADRARRTNDPVRAAWPRHVSRTLVLPGQERLTMTDALGRGILQLEPGTNNMERVPPGVYFLRGADPLGRVVGRIVKVDKE
ncbi:hypothetical protein FJY69_08475 [candidate division WOR-3 bacterium]|nr:hypothetical protein [candidate division WOR-3 bacterium]